MNAIGQTLLVTTSSVSEESRAIHLVFSRRLSMLFYTLHLQASANDRLKNNFVLLTLLSDGTWFYASESAHVSL